MERKFQCNDCGITFDANDSVLVSCPACGSDNITPLKPKSKLLKYIALGMVAALLAFGMTMLIRSCRGDNGPIGGGSGPQGPIDTIRPKKPPVSEDIELGLAPLMQIKQVTPDKKSKTYSFTVAPAKTIAGTTYKYQLNDFATGKMVKEQSTGVFTGIAPATDPEGSYIIHAYAYDKAGTQVEDATLEITGCVKFPDANLQKRTVAQVQADITHMIKSQSTQHITTSGNYATNIRFSCSDGESISSFGEILQQVNFGMWSKVNVGNVGYDSDNRVNSISLNVQ